MILCFKRSKRAIFFLNNFIQYSMQYITTIRSNRSQMFFEIGILKACNIHRKRPALEFLFNKVASLETCNFIKKKLQQRCFPVNIATFLRKFYLKNTTGGCFCTFNSSVIWWHIQIGKLMTYIFNIILCVSRPCLYNVYLHFFCYQFCWGYWNTLN